ncbi:transferrin-binding protein-like solute binding protein, partial [Ursidibacter arcticus]
IMKKTYIAATILIALGVTACSGGGGKNSATNTQHSSQNTPMVENKEKQPETSAQKSPVVEDKDQKAGDNNTATMDPNKDEASTSPNQVNVPSNIEKLPQNKNVFSEVDFYKGTGFNFPRTPGKEVQIVSRAGDIRDVNYLQVDGYEVDIFPMNWKASSLSMKSGNLTKLAERNTYTLFSIIDDKSRDDVYIIANGVNPTKNMDSLSGIAHYKGSGYHGYQVESKTNITDSTVEMDVDFSNKFLTGKIISPEQEFKDINFGAHITGNSFQGKMDNTKIEGGFFGDKAEEAISHYINTSDKFFGVFGVKK